MQFSQVVGQESIKKSLRDSALQQRIPHAQLFLGPEGSGNLALALAYIQFIACEKRTDFDSCGECGQCRKMNALIHPDVHFSFPFPASSGDVAKDLYPDWRKFLAETPYGTYESWLQKLEAGNKQGNIPKKECREIIKSLSLKPFENGFKVLLMWLPEFLGEEGNVLLKLIEEPPYKTLFILVAHQSDRIINTILSRTQLVRVPPVDEANLTKFLLGKEVGEKESQRIAMMSGGDVNRALELLNNEENEYLEPLRNWMRLCFQKNLGAAIKWGDEYAANGREKIKSFLTYKLEIVRASMLLPYLGERTGLSPEEHQFVVGFGQQLNNPAKIELLYSWTNEALYEVERNAQNKIVFADLTFKLIRLLMK